jgi:hypothetical protein
MIQRCTNPNQKSYSQYGGAGVKVCHEWMTFAGFLASMGERPEGTSLGRVLDMRDYVVGNAFWMTKEQQTLSSMNKRALLKWRDANVNQRFNLQVAA